MESITIKESKELTETEASPVDVFERGADYGSTTAACRQIVSLHKPLDLLASLPYLLGGDLAGQLAVIYCDRANRRLSHAVTCPVPNLDADLEIAAKELEGVLKPSQFPHWEEPANEQPLDGPPPQEEPGAFPIAVVVFGSETATPVAGEFVEKLTELARAARDSLEVFSAWLVSADRVIATDLLDPDRQQFVIAEETAEFRTELEECLEVEAERVNEFLALLNESPDDSELIETMIDLSRKQRRTSAKFRRQVENELYEWLTGDSDSQQPRALAQWLVGVEDRRIREPMLKRIHAQSVRYTDGERIYFFDQVAARLVQLISQTPPEQSAAMTSILALIAWQNSDRPLVRAAVQFGRRQDPMNALLRLVEGAAVSGLPSSAWTEIMSNYSLTELRAG